MKLRRFTEEGMERVQQFWDDLEEGNGDNPADLLNDDAITEVIPDGPDVPPKPAFDRWAFARWADGALSPLKAHLSDVGMWSWLTIAMLDIVLPAREDGKRTPLARARYVPELSDYKRYYRHLLVGPWLIYRTHRRRPDAAFALLCQPLHRPGELVEQIASRQEFVSNPSVTSLTTRLYFDDSQRELKRGSSNKGAGSPRRLVCVLQQFDLTYDLYSMSVDQLVDLLPPEFDRWTA